MVRHKKRHADTMCRVNGCGKRARYVTDPLCYGHYSRLRRNGNTDDREARTTYKHSGGYTVIKVTGHPMARRTGWAFEHRVRLYDKIGPGPHPCHWCGQNLGWSDIVVDHLNERKSDNSDDNLVPACTFCNRSRGAMIPFIRGMDAAALERFVKTLHLMRAA